MQSHAENEAPLFILLAHHSDDTLEVVTHWHAELSDDDLNEMIADYLDGPGREWLIRFLVASPGRDISYRSVPFPAA